MNYDQEIERRYHPENFEPYDKTIVERFDNAELAEKVQKRYKMAKKLQKSFKKRVFTPFVFNTKNIPTKKPKLNDFFTKQA